MMIIAIARLTFDRGDSSTILSSADKTDTECHVKVTTSDCGRPVEPRKKIGNELDCS